MNGAAANSYYEQLQPQISKANCFIRNCELDISHLQEKNNKIHQFSRSPSFCAWKQQAEKLFSV